MPGVAADGACDGDCNSLSSNMNYTSFADDKNGFKFSLSWPNYPSNCPSCVNANSRTSSISCRVTANADENFKLARSSTDCVLSIFIMLDEFL